MRLHPSSRPKMSSQLPGSRPDEQQAALTSTPKSRRGGPRRHPLSCAPCRKHKLRCDRQIPCSTCRRFRRDDECRRNPAASGRLLVTENAPLEPAELSLRSETSIGSGCRQRHPRAAGGSHESTTRQSTLSQRLEDLVNFHSVAECDDTLSQLLAEASRLSPDQTLWIRGLDAREQVQVSRHQLMAILPTRAQSDLLVNFYLDHINWIFQTLHVPSFRREYARFWDVSREDMDFIWVALLFAVISLSSLYVPLDIMPFVGIPRQSIRLLGHVWHQAFQHALRAGESEAKPTLLQLQAFSITQLYWYATNQIETLNS